MKKRINIFFIMHGLLGVLVLQTVFIAFSGSCLSYKKRYQKSLKDLPQGEKDKLLLDNIRRNTNGDLERNVAELIQAGANMHRRGIHERTALHEAAIIKSSNLISMLLERGAGPNDQDFYDCSPLHYAARNADVASAQLLLDYGADKALTNKQGRTARQEALLSEYGPKIISFINLLDLH